MSPASDKAKENWETLSGGDAGAVRLDWRERFATAGFRSAQDFLEAAGEALTKPGLGTRYRARLRVGDEVVYLKRFGGDKLLDRLRRRREDGKWHSPAEREVQAAEAVRAVGIPATRALAWGRQKSGGKERSFVVLSAAPGAPADKFLQRRLSETALRKLARSFAAQARRFHAAGLRHRDFYLCHIFVAEAAGGDFELTLIDLQRVFRPRDATGRWRVKDLAQLNYSAEAAGVSANLRRRFFRDYFAGEARRAKRRLLRAIEQKTASMERRARKK